MGSRAPLDGESRPELYDVSGWAVSLRFFVAGERSARALAWVIIAALAATAGVAQAQNFPTKPIRLVVPFSPGGGTDTLARIIAQRMSEKW
jgi:hypothetical protein